MDAWKKNVLSAEKTMSIKFIVLGGGYFGFGGGGSADFIFMGARIFLTNRGLTESWWTFRTFFIYFFPARAGDREEASQ